MATNHPSISVVIPVYKCADCLEELYSRLISSLTMIVADFEIIMVNDASPQTDWNVIKRLAENDHRVKGINLARNFGQHYAITAGLDCVRGEWIVVMDGDLQDQPEEIIKLYHKAQEGYDIVFGRRSVRKDGFIKKLGSILYYRVFDYLADTKSDPAVANFSLVSRQVIENIKLFREHNRSYTHFVRQVGYDKAYVDIEHSKRKSGQSSYDFNRRFNLALDTIVAYSNKPLRLSIKLGFTFSLIAFIYALYLVFRYFFLSRPPQGWTSVIVAVFFIGGILLANMGIMGLYTGKIFDETKNRPLYMVKEQINV